MTTLEQFGRWDSVVLSDLSTFLMAQWRQVVDGHRALTEIAALPAWGGAAGDGARSAVRSAVAELDTAADALLRTAVQLHDAAIDLASLLSSLHSVRRYADKEGFVIEADATVRDGIETYSVAHEQLWESIRDRRRAREELQTRVQQLLLMATEFDDDLARRLREHQVRHDRITVPVGSSPAANAAFWSALTPAARAELMTTAPSSIGNMDGLPGQVRDAANRRVLATDRLRLERVAKDLQRQVEGSLFGGLFTNADAGLDQTRKRLKALRAVDDVLAQGNRQLLVLNNTDYEDTMAAIAVGNVDTATHVAVFVPGMSSTVAGDIGRYDGEMDSLGAAARAQLAPETQGATVATVTWMNYQVPQWGWSLLDPDRTVALGRAADAGSDRLTTFLDGLDASREHDPHLSVLAHSYGSLTAATALTRTNGVDEFLALGSPGLGITDGTALHLPPGHVYAAEAAWDPVADLGAFGADPGAMRGVTMLSTEEHDPYGRTSGHGSYLDEGSSALHHAALVAAGRGDEAAVRQRPGLVDLIQKVLYL